MVGGFTQFLTARRDHSILLQGTTCTMHTPFPSAETVRTVVLNTTARRRWTYTKASTRHTRFLTHFHMATASNRRTGLAQIRVWPGIAPTIVDRSTVHAHTTTLGTLHMATRTTCNHLGVCLTLAYEVLRTRRRVQLGSSGGVQCAQPRATRPTKTATHRQGCSLCTRTLDSARVDMQGGLRPSL